MAQSFFLLHLCCFPDRIAIEMHSLIAIGHQLSVELDKIVIQRFALSDYTCGMDCPGEDDLEKRPVKDSVRLGAFWWVIVGFQESTV